ncbi:hypothetical protein [Rhodococcus sp. NCIMB 12038]|uniref:hypothetical protein n=1 Tax=Rhodococcus sp. NCIMB 12038 TaxID=933800 RepID=UPI000B3C2B37|nr:hypothetical protein [Rhodococcus sp. NCIMB 12038]OUS97355.1 hypothetical protein CA951_03135 [Rhodococcus sp. NCIMB 12038]
MNSEPEQTEHIPTPYGRLGVDHFDRATVTVKICGTRADAKLYVNTPLSRHRRPDWTEQHRHHTVEGGFAAAWDFIVGAGYRASGGVDLVRSDNGAVSYAIIDFDAAGSPQQPVPLAIFIEALNLLTGDPKWVAERVADDPFTHFLSTENHGWTCYLDA